MKRPAYAINTRMGASDLAGEPKRSNVVHHDLQTCRALSERRFWCATCWLSYVLDTCGNQIIRLVFALSRSQHKTRFMAFRQDLEGL